MGNFIIYNIKTKAGWNLDKHGVKRILITQRNLNLKNSYKWVNYEGKVKSKIKIKLLMAKERCIFLYRGGQNDDFIETETFCRAYNEVD